MALEDSPDLNIDAVRRIVGYPFVVAYQRPDEMQTCLAGSLHGAQAQALLLLLDGAHYLLNNYSDQIRKEFLGRGDDGTLADQADVVFKAIHELLFMDPLEEEVNK